MRSFGVNHLKKKRKIKKREKVDDTRAEIVGIVLVVHINLRRELVDFAGVNFAKVRISLTFV